MRRVTVEAGDHPFVHLVVLGQRELGAHLEVALGRGGVGLGGELTAAAVAIPTAAARSGSPAVLSRTFQVTWRTAAPATRTKTNGSTNRS